MRHGRHYVDELLGDTPIRTVREIPISEIEPPPDETLDLDRLEASIRRLGVMEPLLVTSRGLEYRVIAGMRRLRAARTVGLNTVPCLVHDVNDERLDVMRDAASERLAAAAHVDPLQSSSAPGASDLVSELLPAKPPGFDEGLRLAVLSQLDGVELFRAQIASAAADTLTRTVTVERSPSSCAALVDDVLSAVSVEARLRGVSLEKIGLEPDCIMSISAAACRTALTGLLQTLLTLATTPVTALRVRSQITTVRPALIIECTLRSGDSDHVAIADEAQARFFDHEWRDHPCGESAAQVLAALQRTARAHGGRVQAGPSGVTFVVPRPLTDF